MPQQSSIKVEKTSPPESPTHTTSPKRPHSPSNDENGARKRVGKACDRCRLKKSKCDGHMPCSRCRQDEQICCFSERKRSKDKVYPKGYVELLENRTQVLANALQSILECQQQKVDTSNLYPATGRIDINDVLAKFEDHPQLLNHSVGEAFTDTLLENFTKDFDEQTRTRQTSNKSSCPDLSHFDTSSGDDESLHSPTSTIPSRYSFDGKCLSQALPETLPQTFQQQQPQQFKNECFSDDFNLHQSIRPSMLTNFDLNSFDFGQSQVLLNSTSNLFDDYIENDNNSITWNFVPSSGF